MLVKVGPRGQITIPRALRQSLGIKPGDSVAIIQVDGELKLRPITKTIFDLVGSIRVDKALDFDAIHEEVKEYVAQKVLKTLENE
jgi:AbrB family looped-hinge helix DNA binding protein